MFSNMNPYDPLVHASSGIIVNTKEMHNIVYNSVASMKTLRQLLSDLELQIWRIVAHLSHNQSVDTLCS
jgi:hypothetical protein